MPKVYTRTGDDGTTGLLYGGRVSKADLRTDAYGTADEAVSALGLARVEATADGQHDVAASILRMQGELFVLNAELATAPRNWGKLQPGASLVTDAMVERLEREIDELTAKFEQPKDFVVPGNTRVGAHIDHAARIVRRAERAVVALSRRGKVRPEAMRYVNRAADLVWVLARYAERGERQPRHPEARQG